MIDAKHYTGKVQRIDKDGWFSTDLRLYVGRRDCTKLVSAMERQIAAIKSALGGALIEELSIDAKAAQCFVHAEWPLFAKPFVLNGVWIGWARALGSRHARFRRSISPCLPIALPRDCPQLDTLDR